VINAALRNEAVLIRPWSASWLYLDWSCFGGDHWRARIVI